MAEGRTSQGARATGQSNSAGDDDQNEFVGAPSSPLTGKRREILEFIDEKQRSRGYPPSVREIGEAVGLTSSSTVHSHLSTLQRQGYLRRDPTKPPALQVRRGPESRATPQRRPAPPVP